MENVAINLDQKSKTYPRLKSIRGEKQVFDKVVIATTEYNFSDSRIRLEGEERTTRTYIYKTKHNPIKIANNAEFDNFYISIRARSLTNCAEDTDNHLLVATLIGTPSREENWELADKNMSKWFPNEFADLNNSVLHSSLTLYLTQALKKPKDSA